MTSRIGNRGFTLMEVMVATCVLSLGAVLIYESFFAILDSYNYCSDYLIVASWMDEKIWQSQDALSRFGSSAETQTGGMFTSGNKNFRWVLSQFPISKDLCQIDLTLFWRQGPRNAKSSRSAYAACEPK